jgi:anti-repressor protein
MSIAGSHRPATGELLPFTYEDSQVRTVLMEGEPWFAAADVCAVLGYRNSRDAVAKHVRAGQRRVSRFATPSGEQQMTIVSEAGLYRLIMRSNVTDAERFQDWVTDEVLPQIRRTGAYVPAPRELSRLELIDLAREAELGRLAAEQRAAELAPAARAWDQLASAEGDYAVADAAKILSRDPSIEIGQNRLFQAMADLGWIFRRERAWRTYQRQVVAGRLVEKAQEPYRHPRTGEPTLPPPQIRITVKGLQALHRELTRDRLPPLVAPQLT